MERKYGFHRQETDERDLQYSAAKPLIGLPIKTDLRNQLPDCWDQGQTSDCISHGISAGLWNGQVVAGYKPPVMPSRLFNYWNFRDIEGDTGKDEGGQIRNGIKACNVYGVVPEVLWPFDMSKLFTKPTDYVYNSALKGKIHFYASVNLTNLDQIKLALSHGLVVVMGFDVPKYFESEEMDDGGILDLAHTNKIIGGHCVAIVGHDDEEQTFLVRNSWGTTWGINGYFKMGYDFATSNHCSDGWVIRLK